MKRTLLAIAIAATACLMAMAVPAKPGHVTHVQSDGSTVTLVMQGGELQRSMMTMDGLTVARNEHGDYCYVAGSSLSHVLAHDQGSRGLEEIAFIAAYRDQMSLDAASRRAPQRSGENEHPQVPTTGSPRIPIILANYTDIHFINANPVETFEIQFNQMNKSCLHYFESQSRGQFTPQFDILGPVNLPHDRAFYGTNKRIHGTEVDTQLGTMIYDACTALDEVDFSQYDNDGDGVVDVVVVLYAGVGEAQAYYSVPESVWPCQWDMQEALDWECSTTGPFELDGVTINRFAVFNELEGSNNSTTFIDGIGTFCHEFGHCLGLPDFYCTSSGNVYGMSTWSIMDHGCYLDNAHTPAGYTSYERHFMGWLDYIEPEENTQYLLAPLSSDEGRAVKVTNDANPDEYYLVEYRTRTGWDAYIAGEGIMVLHVDYNQSIWDANTVNNINSRQRMTIIPADNVWTGFSNSTDPWPLGARDSLTNNSVPAAQVYTGGFMNKPITAMTVDAEAGQASFWYMKAPESPATAADVNSDGEVTIADINIIIDDILAGKGEDRCDVNGDGEVTVADINFVIDVILGLK